MGEPQAASRKPQAASGKLEANKKPGICRVFYCWCWFLTPYLPLEA